MTTWRAYEHPGQGLPYTRLSPTDTTEYHREASLRYKGRVMSSKEKFLERFEAIATQDAERLIELRTQYADEGNAEMVTACNRVLAEMEG